AGGGFTTAGGATVNGIARWDGEAWHPLETGMGGAANEVYALAVLPSGDLVAGGAYRTAGGVNIGLGVPRRGSGGWRGLAVGGDGGPVYSLAVPPSGDLVAGAEFSTAGGTPVNFIARWNGSAWFPLGTGVQGSQTQYFVGFVFALRVLPGGDLAVG